MNGHRLYFAGEPGLGYGWGTANQHLLQELSKLTEVVPLDRDHPLWDNQCLEGDLFVPLTDICFTPVASSVGCRNFGYAFFELELQPQAVAAALRFDTVFAGSSWCLERMLERGIRNGALLLQGIDPAQFCLRPPVPRAQSDEFRIFSGGKLELRKGQDLVLAAFRTLQHQYPRMKLVTAWFNHWPACLATLESSPYIRFEWIDASWDQQMRHLLAVNDIDPGRVEILPLMEPPALADAYHSTDLGIFPNRCEGGTNLVMMEYMACGKTVIASFTSGHRDILTEKNSWRLMDLEEVEVVDEASGDRGVWQQPSVESLARAIEHIYHHREEARMIADQAAVDLRCLTWERTARALWDSMRQGR